jgi:hypothetical protein
MVQNNPKRKRATVNPDHTRRRQVPAPSDPEIERRLDELVRPAVYAEIEYYRQLGLRNRLLTLPVMVAAVLAMVWRQVPGVCTLQRMLARERILWAEKTVVSQPALSERFLTFPAVLFERVLYRVIAHLPERYQSRSRPHFPLLEALKSRFAACYAVDGTTLEALFRKLKSLQEAPDAPLAGHLVAVVDLVTHLPAKLWWFENSQSNDKAAIPDLLAWLVPDSLLVFDLGYFSFPFFDALTDRDCWFVTRLRKKTSYQVQQVLIDQPRLREQIVQLGKYRSNPSQYPVRLIEIYLGKRWYQYLTNVLEPQQLSVLEVVSLYDRRWHIETTFLLVKRLLDLAYLWVGSLNGVQLQVWATFLFYAILIDLCDEVAEQLQLPLERISVEMVYRSLYFYSVAVSDGYTKSASEYLAEEAHDLGIIKRQRPRASPTLKEQVRRALVDTTPLPVSCFLTSFDLTSVVLS